MSEQEVKPQKYWSPFNCPNCGTELGTTNGRELIIDSVLFTQVTKLTCGHCLTPYEWEPAAD